MQPTITASDLYTKEDFARFDMIDRLASQACVAIAGFDDDQLRKRLDEIFGECGLSDLKGRLGIQHWRDGAKTYYIDGAPFMKASAPETTLSGSSVTINRRFWRINHPLDAAT